MSFYQLNKLKFGTHMLIIQWLGKNNLILDVGCNSGYLGSISNENCFYGIEIDKNKAKEAKKVYKKVLIGNIEKLINLTLQLPKFDIIVFADILEHLIYPKKALIYFIQNFLKDNGKVVVSLPNIAHLSIRLNLLFGRFNYTNAGILDKTHLHFYNKRSADKLVNEVGLKIIKIAYSSNRLGWLINKVTFLGTLFGFNLIFLCEKNKND